MNERPVSVTIVGWFLIISAVISLFAVWQMFDPAYQRAAMLSALSYEVQRALTVIGVGITFVCGVGILRRANWARWLYVVWSALSITLAAVTGPLGWAVPVSIAILALIAFLLFRKPASDWFAGRPADERSAPEDA